MTLRAGVPPQWRSPESLLLFCIAAGYILWILSLPLFPTQDGPIHLYYVSILRDLFSGRASTNADFFYLKHLLPPYSLYYYSLLLLSKVMPLLTADKLIVSLYVASFLYGFRFLARLAGPGADTMALLASFLLLNWPLMMGFVNFCLSLTFALWALGWWFRSSGSATHGPRVLFVLFAVLIVFTHPVPLLVVIAVTGVDLGMRLYRRQTSPARMFLFDLAAFSTTFVLLAYVKLFTSSAVLQQLGKPTTAIGRFVHRVKFPEAFAGADWASVAYQLGIFSAFLIPLLLARSNLKQSRPQQAAHLGRMLLWIAIGSAIALPFIPHDLNGSHFFADRLTVVVWLAALLAGSTWSSRAGSHRLFLRGFVGVFTLFVLFLANRRIRPVADSVSTLEATPRTHVGEVGLAVQGLHYSSPPTGLSYDPYLWASASYFRHNSAILYNVPWLDLEIIPIGARPPLAHRVFSPSTLESPWMIGPQLTASPSEASVVFHQASFILVDTGSGGVAGQSVPAQPNSLCAVENRAGSSGPWYYVCDKPMTQR